MCIRDRFYSLGSCNTCQRILGQLNLDPDFKLKDIKKNPITTEELVQLKALSGSYEALFSKRAMRYKELGLKEKNLSEVDFKGYILEHYTFLKRPVLVFNDTIFIGNSAKVTEAAQTALLNEK